MLLSYGYTEKKEQHEIAHVDTNCSCIICEAFNQADSCVLRNSLCCLTHQQIAFVAQRQRQVQMRSFPPPSISVDCLLRSTEFAQLYTIAKLENANLIT